jgi:hypothetical protein
MTFRESPPPLPPMTTPSNRRMAPPPTTPSRRYYYLYWPASIWSYKFKVPIFYVAILFHTLSTPNEVNEFKKYNFLYHQNLDYSMFILHNIIL